MSIESFYIKRFVDQKYLSSGDIDHEAVSKEFLSELSNEFDDARFEKLLIISGFIPDLYGNDSSEETLYSKLVEALVCEWANRIGANGRLIKQKASYEDIQITIGSRIIVSDAKSFRLGRSQQAPNAKDFLKLEDIRKWMSRYPNALGGLVTYPCKHEWTEGSDVYQYCSTKDAPTVMLPYKYLAFLLHYKKHYNVQELLQLWDYNTMFPEKLVKNMPGGNKSAYWRVMNATIMNITKVNVEEFAHYMCVADSYIDVCVEQNLSILSKLRRQKIKQIQEEVNAIDDVALLKREIIEYKVKAETDLLNKLIERITKFRQ